MDSAIKPIAATTSLSLLIHGVAFAGLLLVYDQSVTRSEGVGKGVDIHLVSSVAVADQQQVDVSSRQAKLEQEVAAESLMRTVQKKLVETVLTTTARAQSIHHELPAEAKHVDENRLEQLPADAGDGHASIVRATNASQQQHAILELLHRSISDKKEYPYLARRQRREGVATVAFVLHPDGKIENAHLVSSSRAKVLDRAALTAVRHIEPFTAAREYLERSEAFQVDIAFELL